MDRLQLDWLLDALDEPRRVFYYQKEEYARYLLERQTLRGALKLKDLAQSRWGKLLERPLLKQARSQWGDGLVDYERLQLLRSAEPLSFRLSLSEWGNARHRRNNYDQTSRPGYNLVVQLNFARDHNREYQRLVAGGHRHPFKYWSHPTQADGREFTLAWARIDLSHDLTEALIEEIQTDWWRAAQEEVIEHRHRKRDAHGNWREWTTKRSRHRLEVAAHERYLNEVLSAYGKVWAEATLTATLKLLWEEIGVRRVYYHTHATGAALKNCRPPRSIYTQLPNRFCFEKVAEHPSFLTKRLNSLQRKLKEEVLFWRI